MDLIEKAKTFATRAHGAQLRKYSGRPYIEHPEAVAELVACVPHTDEMLAAAWLHDTVEDTATTLDDIEREFGAEVAELVGWLTDVSRPEDGNRARRKAIDLDHLRNAPPQAMTIKLADLIDNAVSITANDSSFAKVFLPEKAALLNVLHRGDPLLLGKAQVVLKEFLSKLDNKETA